MKILHVISSLNPVGGGPAETLRQFIPVLIDMGHELTTVSLDPEDALWIENFPGTVVALEPGHTNYQYSPHLVPWLKQHACRFDVVVVRGIWQYHSFAVWRALRGSRTPYVVFTHGMLDPWFKKQYPLKHLKKWLYWPWAEYRVLRDASAVLFTSEEECRLARESFWLYYCNERVVSYGTSTPPQNHEHQKDTFTAAFPKTKGKRLILYLSRIHPKKGCDLLIQAFTAVAARDEALHLVMAGPDKTGWRLKLEVLARALGIQDRITWAGMLSDDLKWGAYHSAEVFILPSHQENFGIVVAEALACGVPVLISNKVNIWREVLKDQAGMVADDTLEGTGQLLKDWFELPAETRDKFSTNARRSFQSRFEIRSAVKSLVENLEDVVAAGKAC